MPPHPRRPFRKRIVLQREAHAPAWHQHLTLPDGRALLLRPIAPADAGPLRQGFALRAAIPDWETLPYDLFSPHPDIVSQRVATLLPPADAASGGIWWCRCRR
jgi:hypothetical protein